MSSLTPRVAGTASPYATLEGVPVGGSATFGNGAPPAGLSEPPKLRPQVLRSLKMHRTLALAVGGFVAGLLVLFALSQKRAYEAESFVYVEPIIAPRLSDLNSPGYDSIRYDSYLQQQILTVTRADTLVAALHTLPPNEWRLPNESEQSAVARLQAALKVERVLNSFQIGIKLMTGSAEKSAAIVNAVTEAYLRGGRKDELAEMDDREQLLGDERQRIKDELETDRREQAALGTSLGVANPVSEMGNPFDTQTASLRAELAAARQAHDVAAAQLSSMGSIGTGSDQQTGLSAAAADSANTDAGLSALKASVNARRAALETDKAGLTPSNPRYQQDQDEIADLDRTLDTMAVKVQDRAERNIQDKLRAQLESTAGVEARLNGQLAAETAKATGAGPKLQRAAELSADIQRLTQRFGTVDNALRELQLQTGGTGMAHLALAAVVPVSPQPSKRGLLLLMALPVGLLAGTAAAVLARARDKRLYIGADLEEAIGFAPMAVLPATLDVPDRVYDEYLLRLAAAVEGAYRTASARTFVLTAVSPKTHAGDLAHALARKLEDLRLKVAVVRSGALLVTSAETMEYRAQTAAGLADAFAEEQRVRMQHAGESIASAKLDRMKAENDLVLIDAAPVLHSAETEYAARCSDATILVVESGVTLSTELKEATALLSRLQVAGVGAVLEELHLENADDTFKKAVGVVEQRRLKGVAEFAGAARQEAPVVVREKPAAKPRVESWPKPAEVEAVRPVVVPKVEVAAVAAALAQAEVAAEPVEVVAKPVKAEVKVAEQQPAPVEVLPMVEAGPMVEAAPPVEVAPVLVEAAEVVLRPVARRSLGPKSWKQDDSSRIRLPEDWREDAQEPAIPQRARFVAEEVVEEEPVVARPAMRPAAAAEPLVAVAQMVPVAAATSAPALEVAAQPVEVKQPEPPRVASAGVGATGVGEQQEALGNRPGSDEDPHAVGRFVGKKDRIGAVPSYTRSKIRLAFKEQEVNSKTTWFSKLFRGDPPAAFRIVPEDDENGEYAAEQPAPVRAQQRVEEAPDPELQQLLRRINSREHELRREQQTKVVMPPAPVAQPVAPVAQMVAVAAPVSAPERFAPIAQPAAPAYVPAVAAEPVPTATVARTAPPAAGRLPRPLSFQQLTGEAPIERPSAARAAATAASSGPSAPPATSEIPLWPEKESPAKTAQAFVASAPPVATTSWNFPQQREPVQVVNSIPAVAAPSAPVAEVAAVEPEVSAEVAAPAEPELTPGPPVQAAAPEPPVLSHAPPQYVPTQPGPSSRLEAQMAAHEARVPDPTSDPAPSPRNYRLEHPVAGAPEAPAEPFVERRRSEAEKPAQPAEAIVQHPRRRSTDAQGDAGVPGLTRRWALLSQFESELSDPLPAGRRSHLKTDVALPPLQSQTRPEER
jgi:uncharacterized protein involved in exopolysaccharide biosynthesis